MKTKIFGNITWIVFICFIVSNEALSWNDDVTHRALSEYAAEASILNKDKGDYLKNIGFEKGLLEFLEWSGNSTIKKGYVIKWLGEGAMLEDDAGPLEIGYLNGKARAYNHFHNPLKSNPWDTAGLDDWILLPPYHVTGKSSLLWAQDGTYQQDKYEGDWSWQTIRNHYYLALTSPADAERQANFAKTFRGLGHQMHLIQDVAQPAHVKTSEVHHAI